MFEAMPKLRKIKNPKPTLHFSHQLGVPKSHFYWSCTSQDVLHLPSLCWQDSRSTGKKKPDSLLIARIHQLGFTIILVPEAVPTCKVVWRFWDQLCLKQIPFRLPQLIVIRDIQRKKSASILINDIAIKCGVKTDVCIRNMHFFFNRINSLRGLVLQN